MDRLHRNDASRHYPVYGLEGHPRLEQRLFLSALSLAFLHLYFDTDWMRPSGSVGDESGSRRFPRFQPTENLPIRRLGVQVLPAELTNDLHSDARLSRDSRPSPGPPAYSNPLRLTRDLRRGTLPLWRGKRQRCDLGACQSVLGECYSPYDDSSTPRVD